MTEARRCHECDRYLPERMHPYTKYCNTKCAQKAKRKRDKARREAHCEAMRAEGIRPYAIPRPVLQPAPRRTTPRASSLAVAEVMGGDGAHMAVTRANALTGGAPATVNCAGSVSRVAE